VADLSRRTFLKLGGGLALAIGIPAAVAISLDDDSEPVERPAGLKGDGSTDDTRALQRAIATAAGELHIPRGEYRISAPITVDRPIRIRGDGSGKTILRHVSAVAHTAMVVEAAGVTLEGLTIDTAGTVAKSGVYGLMVKGSGFTGRALEMAGSGGAIVSATKGARWLDCSSGVWVNGSTGCAVEGCTISGSETEPRICLVSAGSHGCVVRDNHYASDSGSDAAVPAIAVEDSDGVTLEGNSVDASNWYGIEIERASGARVVENEVTRPGRLRSDRGPTVSGIELIEAPGALVQGNTVRDCGGYGIAVVRCSSVEGAPVRVEGNAVDRCDDPGVTVQGSSSVSISSNTVRSATWGFTIGEDSAVCDAVDVSGNHFAACPYGGGYVRGSSGCRVNANEFAGCGEDPRVEDRADAVIVLWDASGRKGVSQTEVTDNTATTGSTGAGAPAPVPPTAFVRNGAALPFPSRYSRDVRVDGNRFL
jgi:parallel beta-helix repeat protein